MGRGSEMNRQEYATKGLSEALDRIESISGPAENLFGEIETVEEQIAAAVKSARQYLEILKEA